MYRVDEIGAEYAESHGGQGFDDGPAGVGDRDGVARGERDDARDVEDTARR